MELYLYVKVLSMLNARCLEMSNPDFDIRIGDQYKVTDKDDYPDDNPCHWYELTSENDNDIILNVWNDPEHMIINDKFEKV